MITVINPNIELKGADRVFEFVLTNLDTDQALDVLNKLATGEGDWSDWFGLVVRNFFNQHLV